MFKSDAAYFVYGKELLGDMTELSLASDVPSRRRYLISDYPKLIYIIASFAPKIKGKRDFFTIC